MISKKTVLAVIFSLLPSISLANNKEIECLATNIYHEARGESTLGKVAVGLVVLNRVKDSRWPNSICKVVYDGKKKNKIPIKNKCQFSWWCDGKPDKINKKSKGWKSSVAVAEKLMLTSKYSGLIEGATFYHSTKVSPSWKNSFTRVVQIDNHIFYK